MITIRLGGLDRVAFGTKDSAFAHLADMMFWHMDWREGN